jgi:hypothetical protein
MVGRNLPLLPHRSCVTTLRLSIDHFNLIQENYLEILLDYCVACTSDRRVRFDDRGLRVRRGTIRLVRKSMLSYR